MWNLVQELLLKHQSLSLIVFDCGRFDVFDAWLLIGEAAHVYFVACECWSLNFSCFNQQLMWLTFAFTDIIVNFYVLWPLKLSGMNRFLVIYILMCFCFLRLIWFDVVFIWLFNQTNRPLNLIYFWLLMMWVCHLFPSLEEISFPLRNSRLNYPKYAIIVSETVR